MPKNLNLIEREVNALKLKVLELEGKVNLLAKNSNQLSTAFSTILLAKAGQKEEKYAKRESGDSASRSGK